MSCLKFSPVMPILEKTYLGRQITVERIERNPLSENNPVLRTARAFCIT